MIKDAIASCTSDRAGEGLRQLQRPFEGSLNHLRGREAMPEIKLLKARLVDLCNLQKSALPATSAGAGRKARRFDADSSIHFLVT
jgi:hypothetical protein